eukprot:760818-Hanusia_phi.AAC.2
MGRSKRVLIVLDINIGCNNGNNDDISWCKRFPASRKAGSDVWPLLPSFSQFEIKVKSVENKVGLVLSSSSQSRVSTHRGLLTGRKRQRLCGLRISCSLALLSELDLVLLSASPFRCHHLPQQEVVSCCLGVPTRFERVLECNHEQVISVYLRSYSQPKQADSSDDLRFPEHRDYS